MKNLRKMAAVLFAMTYLSAMYVNAQDVETVAGLGNVGIQDGVEASFHVPADVLVLPGGGILVADKFNNLLRLVDTDGETSTFAGIIPEFFPIGFHRDGVLGELGLFHPSSLALSEHGWIYIADASNNSIRVIVGDRIFTHVGWGEAGFADGPRGVAAFNHPSAITMAADGVIYVADTLNHVIRRVGTDGYTTTLAGIPGEYGYENGPADAALFDSPSGIAVSSDGRIFVADTGNHVIKVIENGVVSTLAGSSNLLEDYDFPVGGFADGAGDVAMFNQPRGLAMWGDYLIVADSANHSIRLVAQDGYVTTIFGAEFAGYELETLHFPMGISVYGNRLYIADSGNNKIRMILLWDYTSE